MFRDVTSECRFKICRTSNTVCTTLQIWTVSERCRVLSGSEYRLCICAYIYIYACIYGRGKDPDRHSNQKRGAIGQHQMPEHGPRALLTFWCNVFPDLHGLEDCCLVTVTCRKTNNLTKSCSSTKLEQVRSIDVDLAAPAAPHLGISYSPQINLRCLSDNVPRDHSGCGLLERSLIVSLCSGLLTASW